MKRTLVKLLPLVVFSVGFCVIAASQTHHRHHRRSTPVDPGTLRGQLRAVRSEKAHVRAELRRTQTQSKAVAADLESATAQLAEVSDNLNHTTSRLQASRAEQTLIAARLADAIRRTEQIKQQVRRRLRAIYLTSTGSFLTSLVRSESVGDAVSRGFLMRTVAKKDQEVFAEYRRQKQIVAEQKARQDRVVIEVAGLERREVAEHQDLDKATKRQSELLAQLHVKESEFEETLAQFGVDEQNIAAQIAAYARRPRAAGQPHEAELPAFHGRFMQPVAGRISDGYGMRFHPILHINRMHYGVDFAAPTGSPIHAAADGQVISTLYMRGYGNVVILDHGGGISTVYGHCSEFLCSEGQHVSRGETIARVGATGLATGPHCHFEVRINGHAVDPMGHF